MEPKLVKRGDYWWPEDDDWCHKVIHDEVSDIDLIMAVTPGRELAIQAGGNVGVWANYLAAHFKSVLTFEPDPTNYACLTRNRDANVESHPVALGEHPSTGALHLVPGNSGAHWTVEGTDFQVITIDGLDLPVCDLIILDIEGSELAALKGATDTILKHRPVIHFEQKGLGERYYDLPPKAAEDYVLSLGYRVHSKVRKDVLMVPK